MSQANELLDSLDNEATAYTASPETEPHIVVEFDRYITVPVELVKIGVQHDHMVETVTFDCPRYWDEHDLSTMKICINYERSDGETGCDDAENISVDADDDSIMHFQWTLTRHATALPGTLHFAVCAKNIDDFGNELQHWSSEICEEIYISEGLNCSGFDPKEYPTQEGSIEITENGTVEIVPDKGYAFSKVTATVNVTEALPTQEKTIDILENGTSVVTPDEGYTLSSVTVNTNVAAEPEPVVEVVEKDICFYDYDGTLLYSYTHDELSELTELPALPEHEGLIGQGWNYTLDQLKTYSRLVDVGAMYITDDGATRLYISIKSDNRRMVRFCFTQDVSNGVTIDWGDGSDSLSLAHSGEGVIEAQHQYATVGNYVISLTCAEGCTLGLGGGTNLTALMGGADGNIDYYYYAMLTKVELGRGVTAIPAYAFSQHINLSSIVIHDAVTSVGAYAFSNCSSLGYIGLAPGVTTLDQNVLNSCGSLRHVSLPEGITSVVMGAFGYTWALKRVTLPDSITTFGNAVFSNCNCLEQLNIPASTAEFGQSSTFAGCTSLAGTLKFPATVTALGSSCFANCYSVEVYDFTAATSVPALNYVNSITTPIMGGTAEVWVPAHLYNEWITATNWSQHASHIVAV